MGKDSMFSSTIYTPICTLDEQRRQIALATAIEVSGRSIDKSKPDEVVEMAKVFEKYLKGSEEGEGE